MSGRVEKTLEKEVWYTNGTSRKKKTAIEGETTGTKRQHSID
jgi:hypothetical protein